MSNSIFVDNFPLINTNQELKKLFKEYPDYDEYYIASGSIQDRRDFFNEMWNFFKPYADPDFLLELKQRGKFHQRSWELYVGFKMIKIGFTLKEKGVSVGPDIITNNNIYIECIATTHGLGVNSVPELDFGTLRSIQLQKFPSEEIIMRITSAIHAKIKQYGQWKNKSRFDKENGYIIAINSGELVHLQDYLHETSIIIQTLFGTHNIQYNQQGEKKINFRDQTFTKKNGSIDVNYFCTEKYNDISGIIFSGDFVINLEESNKCVFINNPFASHPIPNDLFNNIDQRKATKNDNGSLDIQYIPAI